MIYHRIENAPDFNGLSRCDSACTASGLAFLDRVERESALARLQSEQQRERRQETLRRLFKLWPVAVGVVFACFAPLLRDMLAPFDSWGMRILFPFVLLSARHELQWGDAITRTLPEVMLYAQFPFEGLLAKIALKSRVTLAGVIGQLFLIHFLAVVGLWFICAAEGQLPVH